MEEKMKKIGREMSVLMGVTLSLALSLLGNLTSGRFTPVGFLISFILSTIISLIIGFLVPMKKITDSFETKHGIQPGSMKARLYESLVSDLIYTPIITIVMIVMAYKNATAHGANIPFAPMIIRALVLSLIVGYILIFIFMPLYLKLVMKKNNVNMHEAE